MVDANKSNADVDTAKKDEEGMVVNVEHLMAYVEEQKAEGNAAFKGKRYNEALAAWQRGLDAIAQSDGRPIHDDDVQLVMDVRSVLHSNRGQALISLEFWRRAVPDLDAAITFDPQNAKAIWRRCKVHEALKQWDEAEADVDRLLDLKTLPTLGELLEKAGVTEQKLEETRQRLATRREAADKAAAEALEAKAKAAEDNALHELREKFEEVTRRNGLHGNTELAAELADMVTRPGGVTAQFVAGVYQIDEEDAETLLAWVQQACLMKDALNGVVQFS